MGLYTERGTTDSAVYMVESNLGSIRLCVLAGASCWVLYVDVLVLEMGGELASRRSAVGGK